MKYQLEIKQLVDYPRCRIYRSFIRNLMEDRNIRTNGGSYLFYYIVLCSYANYRMSRRRLEGMSYTLQAGEWICAISIACFCFSVTDVYGQMPNMNGKNVQRNSSLSSASIRGKNFSRQPVSVLMAQEYTFLKDTRFSSLLFPSISQMFMDISLSMHSLASKVRASASAKPDADSVSFSAIIFSSFRPGGYNTGNMPAGAVYSDTVSLFIKYHCSDTASIASGCYSGAAALYLTLS